MRQQLAKTEHAQLDAAPWIDLEEFNPSYLKRALPLMPKLEDHAPWLFNTDYYVEREELPDLDLDEAALVYQAARQKIQ